MSELVALPAYRRASVSRRLVRWWGRLVEVLRDFFGAPVPRGRVPAFLDVSRVLGEVERFGSRARVLCAERDGVRVTVVLGFDGSAEVQVYAPRAVSPSLIVRWLRSSRGRA